MKLQKQSSRWYWSKNSPKRLVVNLPSVVDDLWWQEVEDLEPLVEGQDLRLRHQRR